MKKNRNFLIFLILILFTLFLNVTCKQNIGLGGTIDIERPNGEITYPDAGETPIRGSFVMKGYARDDEGVKDVSVVFKNTETDWVSPSYPAVLSNMTNGSVAWTLSVNNEFTGRTRDGHPLVKEYPIPDGKYIATVTVTDITGRTTSFSREYDIDNTPPVFIVSRPSTIIVNDDITAQADPYGSVFMVVGQAEDRSKIEDLTLTVDGTNISVSKKFVGKNINEEIATATKNATEFTDPLYKYNADNASPKIKAHISLTDNARFFKADGNESQGNTSEWYYLRDRDIRSVLGKGYTADVINDYFAGKKGSAYSLNKTKRLLAKLYDDGDPEGQSVKQILENARIMTKVDPGVTDQKFSFFTLDPNKSPGFKVTNGTNFPQSYPATTPDADLPHPGVEFFSGSVRPKVSLKLIPNKNNAPLVESFNYNGYRASGIVINMYKCTAVSYVTSGDKKILNLAQSAVPSYSLKFADLSTQDEIDQVVTGTSELTVQWQLPNPATFSAGYYVIEVEGKDTENNDFVAYDRNNSPGGSFVIKFEAAGTHLMILPGAPSGFVKEAFHVIANVSSGQPVTKVCYKLDGAAGESDTELLHSSGTEWKTAAPVSLASLSEGEHKVHFWAKNSTNQTAMASIDFIKDTKAPESDITYPESNDVVAGTVKIRGTVTDAHAGVNKDGTRYIIGKQPSEPTASTTGWRVMDDTKVVSWEFTYNLDDFSSSPSTYGDQVGSTSVYKIPVYILTEDTIGNKGVKRFTVNYDSDGDKPVITVLSPQQNQTLGGTIQIFGTASTRLGGFADVGEVYIQFSKDGNFENTANGNMTFGTSGGSYDADWYKAGKGQAVPNTASGGSNWQISINENGEFNNPNGQNWEIYFRLRAIKKGTTNKYGAWSNPIKIFIDKAYPTIGSPDPLKLVNKSNGLDPINYTSGMWIADGKKLIGSLYDDSGIKTVEISSLELLGNQKYNLQQALSQGWIAEDAAHAPTSPGAKNYMLQIPLDLNTLSEAAKRKGEITIKIKIVDVGQNLLREETLKFNFDIMPPAGDVGDFIYRYSGNVRISYITDSRLAQEVKNCAPGSSPDYSKLNLLINDKIRKVTNVSGSTVSFAPNLDRAGTYNCLLYKAPYIIRNDSGNWIVRGVANDDGSGIKKIEATVTVDGQTAQSGEITGDKITQHLGGQVSWEGEIDLSTLKDGKGKLSCKIYDEQGNVYNVPDADIVVKNKPIVVSKVTLSTDIAGSPESFENNTTNKALKNVKTDSNLDFTADFASTEFAFKNKNNSKIKVDFTGGYGTVKYQLKKENGTLLGGLTAITSGGEIDLKNHFGTTTDKINNSNGTPTKIILELWGEAAGYTQGTDSAFAKINITTLFDALDDKPPTVVILPFHWNSEADNSLYQNSRANGHVEIAKINSLGNNYSSVSGKITLRGFAYDNVKIDSITAEVSGKTLTAALSGNGPWTVGTIASTDGIVLTVEKLGADYLGYYVTWQIDWDTEKIGVGLARDIKVTANDGTTTFSDTGVTTAKTTGVTRSEKRSAENAVFENKKPGQFVVFTKGETQYLTRIRSVTGNKVTLEDDVPVEATTVSMYAYTANEPKTTVNVVPYITEVVTGLAGADGSHKGAFSRASTGEYPVRAGETIKVKGFNLAGGTVMLGTSSLGTNLNGVAIVSSHTSGDLSVKVGSIESVNNKVDITKPYNIEGNGINNDILNARRKLFVWKMEPIINNNFMESPQFVMDSKSNYYMSYGSLAGSDMSFNMMKNGTVNHTSTQMASSNIIEQCYSKYHNTVIAFDDNENMYGGATNTDRAGGSTSFTFFSRERGTNAQGTGGNYNGGTNRRRLENNNNIGRGVYDVNRVQIPKLAVRGPSSDAKVALIYYDRNNNALPIKFRYGSITAPNNISNGLGHNVDQYGTGSDPVDSGSAKGYEVIADNANATVYKSGGYAAVALTSTGRAVAVWYDSVNSRLVYSYRDVNSYTEPAAGASDRKTEVWQGNAVVVDTGAPLYVDVAIDDADGLHIGYYSSGDGGVKYAYLPPNKVTGTTKPASTDFKVVKVDTHMNPGTLLKIGVRKESGKQVPYISYYHNGFYGSANAARIAWLKDGIASAADVKNGVENGKFTGNWVVMTVPASNGIQQYTICQGAPTSGNYANKVIAAYFTTKNYEMAVLQK
ncbi:MULTISPECIES: hypothetical protein [unclassified Treponema]|uniref:hypothetical protein n=1 Tax=unclassified Treponema TaxID=2638727 RepID=UPI0020A24983|nr:MULTISPECIES: hypothetical protein [unclassified Treponema]UTC66428.1 hypothetical protein E4O06_10705 [Treponema sp. OMZ 789]UTC69159.1 hypothetical protein E4O01_10845 [Treponema sp. OMZ 790]UTC71872.1 hypothetical protein E4O02_10935 [Treponema sp. OMZ 791]